MSTSPSAIAGSEHGRCYIGLASQSGSDVITETWVNGIFRGRTDQGSIGNESIAIQHDLEPGKNAVEQRISIAAIGFDVPSRAVGQLPRGAFAAIRLERDEVTETQTSFDIHTTTLVDAEWSPAKDGEAMATLPHTLRIEFDAPANVLSPPWSAATRVGLDQAAQPTRSELIRLAGFLRDGDIERYTGALTERYRHASEVYPLGLSRDSLRAEDFDRLTRTLGKSGSRILTDDQGATCLPCANGRLFSWLRADGAPLLRIETVAGETIGLPLMFSLLNGAWRVTR